MKAIAKLKDDARKHEQREEWDKAISVYVEVLRTAEKGEVEQELPLYNRVGDLYVRLGKPAEAVKYYEQAADHYAEAGLYNNAIALCNKALRYMPDRTELLKKLGHFSALQGFATDARRWYLEYAEKMLQRGALDEAFRALEDFANLSEDAEVRELLGRQLRTHGRTEQAVVELTRAHALRLEAGQPTEAERLKKEILALDPNAFAAPAPPPPAVEPATHAHTTPDELPGLMDLGLESAAGAAFGADAGDLDTSMIDLPGFDAPVEEPVSDESATDLPMLDLSMADPPPSTALDIGMVEIDAPAGIDTSDLGLETGDFVADEELTDRLSADLPLIEDETSFGAAPLPGLIDEPAAAGYADEWEDYPTELPGLDDELPTLEEELPTLEEELPTFDDGLAGGGAALPTLGEELPMLDDALPTLGDDLPMLDDAPPTLDTASPTLEAPLPTLDNEPGDFDDELATLEEAAIPESGPFVEQEPSVFSTDLPTFELDSDETTGPALEYASEDELPPRIEDLSPLDADLATLDGEVPGIEESALVNLEGPGVLGVDDLIEADPDPAGLSDALFELPVGELPETSELPPAAAVPPIGLRGAVPEQPADTTQDFEEDDYELPSIWDDEEEAQPAGFEASSRTPLPEQHPPVEPQPSIPSSADFSWDQRPEPSSDEAADLSWDEHPAASIDQPADAGPVDLGLASTFEVETAQTPVAEPALPAYEALQHDTSPDPEPPAEVSAAPTEPAATGSEWAEPAPAPTELAEPRTAEPGAAEPRMSESELAEPATADPGTAESEFAEPATAEPAVPGSDQPGGAPYAAAPAGVERDTPPVAPTAETAARTDYVDLAAFLAEDDEPVQETTRFVVAEKAPTGDEDRDFADMLTQFKQKVAEHVSFDDAASHYDLGLAYKEMGLIDEAISEFQTALKAGLERLKVFEELGHCFLLKQQYNIAVTVLNRALQLPVADDIDLIGVYYHLARSYEGLGQRDNARMAYERVVGLDIAFQDAAARLSRL